MAEPARALTTPEPEKLRSAELFAGVGGLALGLHAAGFEPQVLVERDELCKLALEKNAEDGRSHTSDWPIEAVSVHDFDFSRVGEIELLSAGAPCQPFSHGGKRRGRGDHRNLFPQVVRALHDLQPPAFVIENVRGLLFRDMEIYFQSLLRELRRPTFHYAPAPYARPGRPRDEYRVYYKVLNAADFGLPQSRQRLFIVGLKPELAPAWEWPEGQHSKEALLAALLADEYWDRHKVPKGIREAVRAAIPDHTRKRLQKHPSSKLPWRTVRDFLKGRPKPYLNPKTARDPWHMFVPDARLYDKHTGSKLDWPAKTVKAGVHGCPGGEHIVVFDDGTHRYFTVRECGLLQGFPDDYAFATLRTPAMRQIGNAVPPPVAEAVGERLAEVLRG